jgi:hypothetical protein
MVGELSLTASQALGMCKQIEYSFHLLTGVSLQCTSVYSNNRY